MKCVPLCMPKDQWRLPPGSSLVTYLGCRSKLSAVGLTPGSTGYCACGISHLSTVATQASAGWKTGNLHRPSPIWAHFLLYSAAASVCCREAALSLVCKPYRRGEQSWLLSSPLFLRHLCVLLLSLSPLLSFEGGQEVMLLSAVVSGCSCLCARTRAHGSMCVSAVLQFITTAPNLRCFHSQSAQWDQKPRSALYLQISCLQKCSHDQNNKKDNYSFWFLMVMMSVLDLLKNKFIKNRNMSVIEWYHQFYVNLLEAFYYEKLC